MFPSEGTVKVRAAERVLHQNSTGQGVSVSFVNHFVQAETGLEDAFVLGEHIADFPNLELRTIISCLCHLLSLYFTK